MRIVAEFILCLAVAGVSYGCTRGPDGSLTGCLLGFGVIGIAYLALIYASPAMTLTRCMMHLVGLEVTGFAASGVGSQLEEMAGMLRIVFIPASIAAFCGAGMLLRIILASRTNPQSGFPVAKPNPPA